MSGSVLIFFSPPTSGLILKQETTNDAPSSPPAFLGPSSLPSDLVFFSPRPADASKEEGTSPFCFKPSPATMHLSLLPFLGTLAAAVPSRRVQKWLRTAPTFPSDLIVRSPPLSTSEYSNISSAVDALGTTGGSIFVFPGGEFVDRSRPSLLLKLTSLSSRLSLCSRSLPRAGLPSTFLRAYHDPGLH